MSDLGVEQVGKPLSDLPEILTPTDGDMMYIVDAEASANSASKKITMSNLKRVLGGNVTGTVEGASVSFSDGADGIPMEECDVTIVPTQDLHGYSKPWAGGAGKNKCDYAEMLSWKFGANDIFSESDNEITVLLQDYTSAGSITDGIPLTTGTWTISIENACRIQVIYDQASQGDFLNTTEATFTLTANKNVYFKFIAGSYPFDLGKVQIESGSQPTTFEPYSNICPISGHTDVTVTVASTSGGSGEDTTVSLGRTVYGGTLDVTTGVLTDEDGTLLVFNSGNTNVWSGAATSPQGITRFYTTPSYVGRTLVISDTYKISSNYATEIGIITMSNDGRIIITPSFGQGKTLDEFKALLADNSFNVLMTLATPQTFNLTPTQVETLLGQNYVSHDGGGTIKVVYIRDLDITINDLINRVTALENE